VTSLDNTCACAAVIHYEETLYQVYAPLPLPYLNYTVRCTAKNRPNIFCLVAFPAEHRPTLPTIARPTEALM